MSEQRYWRQLDFITPKDLKGVKVTIIGCGGIGSWTAFALAKLGVTNIWVWDEDKVELHNVPNQFFREKDVGKNKGKAISDILDGFVEAGKASAYTEKMWDGEDLEGIVISAVDSMDVRKQIWEKCKLNPSVRLLVDGRIGGEDVKVIGVRPTDPDDIKRYEATLFEDEDAEELPCTARAIIDVAFLVTALIVRAIRGFLKSGEATTHIGSMHNPTIEEVSGG